MKRLTCDAFLLHGCILGVSSAIALTMGMNAIAKPVVTDNGVGEQRVGETGGNKKEGGLKPGQVWVLGKNQQVQPHGFAWVVEDVKKASQQPFLQLAKTSDQKKPESSSKKPDEKTKPPKRDDLESFDEVTKDTQRLAGLFTLYRNKEKNKIYLEIKPEQLNKNFLTTATLESGIGEGGIYSGMPLQDFLFYFQRVNNNLQFVVRNVNFRTREGDPQVRSLARSFSDSVLYNISIKSIHPERKTLLIDLGDLLLTDLAGLSSSLGVAAGGDGSYFGNAKTFPQNIEVESVMNVTGAGGSPQSKTPGLPNFETLADSRGFTLRIHYSLSQLPDNNYRPRLADERVGYFITAYQDLSNDSRRDPFVRYVNRWNLEKKDPNAAISVPKKPIVFWIDNAVPFEYRDAIKAGVLMWNQAFAKIGFKDAIQVQQMPDNATWDPADIRYNTIRWINTVDGFFAMGPSRVNPLTGEILDADILVDASFVRALKNDYRQLVQPSQTQNRTSISTLMQNRLLCGNGLDQKLFSQGQQSPNQLANQGGFLRQISQLAGEYDLCYGIEAANQFAVGKMTMTMLPTVPATSEQIKTYIHEYLRLIIAHEVGHTLGLRHNFRGSTMLKAEEMNTPGISHTKGLTASVMDYIPPNIAPKGTKQGDYFPSIVGPYDDWAIKYGYAPIPAATTNAEKPFLDKIAQESATRSELSYSTDEDMFDLDPTVNPWDNSANVLTYSQWQLDNSRQLWDLINKRYPINDDAINDVSEQFGTVLGNYFQNIFFTTKYIGGQSFYRVRSSDRNGRLPFEPVPLEKQREALATLQKYVFAEDAFNFPPELLNKLAPSRWRHWGSRPQMGRLDYPIHDLVLFIQSSVLVDLLSGDRLSRMKDLEMKTKSGKALTIPELFDTLQSGIWTEVIKPKRENIKISSLRRGLQRSYLDILTGMVLRKEEGSKRLPDDARTIAWYKLKQLEEKLKSVNSNDEYTKAHILETRDRIDKILDARIQSN
ncbi:zinc-dependent metalloprotease [Calothrix sp. UHCC 0171]|uniref:zinc-dependent metalloprotease n=1 Tax=Calothrix sp. UHCC 0171 TaxID=3110245 RepID=UPI002B220424|nr:zinc-dependent metalloprotease [Calothrix sp. UHCC 0171]MEA5571415.1 zinc-dependent metalloprotease [Calothrix sp. UHCC 0171]